MSKEMDRWLDICTLLRILESDEEIYIIPAKNEGSVKSLGFQINNVKFMNEYKDTFLEILRLSDWFESSIENGKLKVTVYVDLFT